MGGGDILPVADAAAAKEAPRITVEPLLKIRTNQNVSQSAYCVCGAMSNIEVIVHACYAFIHKL